MFLHSDCTVATSNSIPMTSQTNFDPNRPRYHFTPPTAWLNDPNGMVYHHGEYHLFYQYYPDALVWGPMHWGHAVSRDLVVWEHLPIALYPDEMGMIFSGSAVVDQENTAGFGAGTMVAIFTYHREGYQTQNLAYSHDDGRTWTKYAGNPVLTPPPAMEDFRDPKVFWYAKSATEGHWVMVLAAGDTVRFYTSPNLKQWELGGTFGSDSGSTDGVWETPELFSLPVNGDGEHKWVLVVAVMKGAPAGGSGVQYFVGDFDGNTFTPDSPKANVRWADYGSDFYAPQLWNDAPKGRRIGIAWMNNWSYARETPATTYRGTFTTPREFTLATTPDGIRLMQQPVAELQALRHDPHQWEDVLVSPQGWRMTLPGQAVEIVAEWHIPAATPVEQVLLTLQWGETAEVKVGYEIQKQRLFVERTRAGSVEFHPDFAAIHTAPFGIEGERLNFHLFIDRYTLELFVNEGRVVFSEQLFPPDAPLTLTIATEGGELLMNRVELYDLT